MALLILISFLAFETEYCTAAPKTMEKENMASTYKLLDDLQRGEWLNKTYLEKLKSTRSPRKAADDIYQVSFKIKRKQGSYFMQIIYNFHESGEDLKITGLKQTSKKGVYDLIVGVSDYAVEKNSNFIFLMKDGADEIQWSFEIDHRKVRYSFVRIEPSVTHFVKKLLLAGEYLDQNNRTFFFTDSGRAKWPDKKFRYEVNLDYVMGNDLCDSFFVIDEKGDLIRPPLFYGFSWENERLLIYGEDKKCNKSRPLYILTRKEDK